MRRAITVILVTVVGCVGGITKLRYAEMPSVDCPVESCGVAIVDCELSQANYKPAPTDAYNATRCIVVREGDPDETFVAEHPYGVFTFEHLAPGRYAITQIRWDVAAWIKDERGADAPDRSLEQILFECRFTYNFPAFAADWLVFEVEAGKVTYHGQLVIHEPEEFVLTELERPARQVTRNDYADGVRLTKPAGLEKRVLDGLRMSNAGNAWGDRIQKQIDALGP